MALTINSYPANIDNAAAFNVTSSLSEDASHVNLRVRASIYHEGIVKAIIEQPVGLLDFNFAEILKTLVPGIKLARNTGDIVNTGTVGSNLITGWTNSGYDTFTTTGNVISSAIDASGSGVSCASNTIAVAVGDLLVLTADPYTSTLGTRRFNFSTTAVLKQYSYATPLKNVGTILMCTTAGNLTIVVEETDGACNWLGTFFLYKITTNRDTIGGPLCSYLAFFEEYWETAAGVTTLGADTSGSVYNNIYRFVTAEGDENAFSSYVLTAQADPNPYLFANKTLRDNVTKFFTVNPMEYFVCFFTPYVHHRFYYIKDSDNEPVGYGSWIQADCHEGWGIIIVNIGELMSSVTNKVSFRLLEYGSTYYVSEKMTIYIDTSQIDERVILEFLGLVGGQEYLAFEGVEDIRFITERSYYKGASKNRKPLSYCGINRQSLETRFKDMNNAAYLKSLLVSEAVKKLEDSYAAPTEVTVLTEEVTISKGVEMFTNRLDIEYEH